MMIMKMPPPNEDMADLGEVFILNSTRKLMITRLFGICHLYHNGGAIMKT